MTAEEMREAADRVMASVMVLNGTTAEANRWETVAAAWHQAAALTRIAEALEAMQAFARKGYE